MKELRPQVWDRHMMRWRLPGYFSTSGGGVILVFSHNQEDSNYGK
ncbi:hypothetical protein [Rouxiella silvae]|nr:hypothetical protein [Rouxiella silvae]